MFWPAPRPLSAAGVGLFACSAAPPGRHPFGCVGLPLVASSLYGCIVRAARPYRCYPCRWLADFVQPIEI